MNHRFKSVSLISDGKTATETAKSHGPLLLEPISVTSSQFNRLSAFRLAPILGQSGQCTFILTDL